jgi:nitrite reductase/ring-hydroxylating ferredoxin subunit/uncharacterized membrane protein
MATETIRDVTRAIDAGIADQGQLLDSWAEQLQSWLRGLVAQGGPSARSAKNALHGTWLGHPLHPALTDVPIGAWWLGFMLDLFGVRRGADAAMTIGTLAAVPTALAGAADWSDTESDARRVGLVHAMLNSLGLGCFVASLVARRGESRGLGVALSALGLALASISAWLGGELVYRLGTGVSRTAWEPSVDDFLPLPAPSADALESGKPIAAEVTVEGTKIPLVLVKQGRHIAALSGTCTHWGGPLAEGKLVDGDTIECPWHGSQFRLSDGSVCQGPATVEQPVFEARIRNGQVEVRRAR